MDELSMSTEAIRCPKPTRERARARTKVQAVLASACREGITHFLICGRPESAGKSFAVAHRSTLASGLICLT